MIAVMIGVGHGLREVAVVRDIEAAEAASRLLCADGPPEGGWPWWSVTPPYTPEDEDVRPINGRFV